LHAGLGISTLVFREFSLREAMERISKTGMMKIDLSIILPTFCPHYNPLTAAKEDDLKLKELVDSFGFTVATVNVVPGYFNTDSAEKVAHFARRSVEVAESLRAHSITIPSGRMVEDREWEENVLFVKEHLTELNRYACDRNVTISIETPHVRTLTESVEQAKRFHEILEEPRIKCTLDTSHVNRLGTTNIVDAIKVIGHNRINHVHVRDSVGEDINFTPGKGTCDFVSFFRYMSENRYTGDYVLELEYEDITEGRRFAEIEFAKEYCVELLTRGTLSFSKKFRTTTLCKLVERIKRNPTAEIRRHKILLHWLKTLKNTIKPYLPEKVYDGRWSTKLRWTKNHTVRYRKNTVALAHTPQKVISVGIVGCGYAGAKMHAPGFSRLKGVDLVGFYDIDKGKTEMCAKRFGARACSNLDELIGGCKPDVISVCSREWAHHEAVMKALKNGIDVFCEKLLATRYQDAEEIVDTVRVQKRLLGVNYNYHYMPGIRKIKEVIVQRALGKLTLLNINVHAFSYAHALDLLSFLGGKIVSVSAYYKNDNLVRKFGGTDWRVYDEDILYVPSIAASVTVEFQSGAIGTINSSFYYNLHAFVLAMEAVFEGGVVSLSGINMFNTLGQLTYFSKGGIKKVDMNYKNGVYATGYDYTFNESIRDFMECYVSHRPVPTDGEQALFNMKLEKMIALSNSNHEKVYLDSAET
jgi:predicted dehydrogenase/sugar phosphate isomerase/epimerase